MPTYDYACEENGRVVEVQHRMNEVITSWGELCERVGIDAGNTPKDTPVKKLATGGQVVRSSSLGDSAPACASGGCSRSCGL
ncbi:hypothetical protein MNBD_GAMMA24-1474 [hydrothermal vent metagenome]|uniref:Zinc ribbon domain-containing protein n=1 Tax=hydrothermal vent metagenome TaxID=652676 RepID=A0A3B1BHQ9_9ZZZZ